MAKRRNQARTTFTDLPDEILRLIICKLNHDDRLLSVSLVSKTFRSLTNQFVNNLYFKVDRLPSKSFLHRLFVRFSSVSCITIQSDRIAPALKAISTSGLKVERFEIYGKPPLPKPDVMGRLTGRFGTVKYLRIEGFSDAEERQVVEFIHLFSSLEQLDLSASHVWTDTGIHSLALNVPNLRWINLSANNELGDLSLDALSNCVNLEDIIYYDCDRITAQGLCAFLRKRKNLKSVHLPSNVLSSMEDADMIADTISSSCENLSDLSMEGTFISDTFLHVIAATRSPLTSLDIWLGDMSYTMTGLMSALRALKGLKSLSLFLPQSGLDTQDEEMSQIVKSLPCLEFVDLTSRSTTLYATLFSLIQNCPLLIDICIYSNATDETHCDVPQIMKKNYSIRSITIEPEPDALLTTTLKSICPAADLNSAIEAD